MGSDGPARRREIEDTTAARLAEIVAAIDQRRLRACEEDDAVTVAARGQRVDIAVLDVLRHRAP